MKDNIIPKIKLHKDFDAAILVCFLLDELDSLTEKLLLEIVTFDEITEVFMLSDALGMSEKKGLIEAVKKENEIYYKITEYGKTILSEFINSVPLSIREKALEEGRRVLAIHRLKKSFKWSIDEIDNGYYFKVSLLNEIGGPDIIQIKIFAHDKKNAQDIERRFLEKPAEIIGKTLDIFVNDSYL